jgi:hypothetical protein
MLIDRNSDINIYNSDRLRGEAARLRVVGPTDEEIIDRLHTGNPVFVALVIEDRAFGGHEEGGWWFDTGVVEYQSPAYSVEAIKALCENYRAHEDNEGAFGVGSVCSDGVYVIHVATERISNWPASRPYYC